MPMAVNGHGTYLHKWLIGPYSGTQSRLNYVLDVGQYGPGQIGPVWTFGVARRCFRWNQLLHLTLSSTRMRVS